MGLKAHSICLLIIAFKRIWMLESRRKRQSCDIMDPLGTKMIYFRLIYSWIINCDDFQMFIWIITK